VITLLLACSGGAVIDVPTTDTGDSTAVPTGDCGLTVDATVVYAQEDERIRFDAACANGAAVEVFPVPDGAELDGGEFDWRPGPDQAGIHTLLFTGRGEGFPETASVTVHVADGWDQSDNEPVDPLTYETEYGVPVLHVHADEGFHDTYVGATVFFEGVEYDGARVKKRGAASLNYPKVGYTLAFDETQLELSDRGMGDKAHLVLISTFDDNAHVRQLLAYDLWADMAEFWGIEDRLVVRTFPVILYLDGEYRGVYIAADHVDDEYLEQMGLGREDGLYKAVNHDANFAATNSGGGSKSTWHDGYELKEGTSWAPLDDLVEFTATASDEDLVAQADDWLDSDEFLDWWAFVYFTAAGDSAGKNSYLAYDVVTGRMRFAPWDFNHSWGQDWRTLRVGDDYDDDFSNRNRVFDAYLDAAPERVLERWDAMTADDAPFSEAHLMGRVDAYYEQLEPSAHRDWERWGDEYRSYGGWSGIRTGWTDFEGEREYLEAWIQARAAWARGDGRPD
jgi:hypothetical protein